MENTLVPNGADSTITIEMNNPGGDAYHMYGMYNRIQNSPCRIVAHAYGYLMSAMSVVYQAADVRKIAVDTTMMIHFGSDGYFGHSKDFQIWAEESKRINERMLEIYLYQMNKKEENDGLPKKKWTTKKRLTELINFDKFIGAEQAVKMGLADEIILPPDPTS